MKKCRSRLPSRLFSEIIFFLHISQNFCDFLLTLTNLCYILCCFAAVASIAKDGFA